MVLCERSCHQRALYRATEYQVLLLLMHQPKKHNFVKGDHVLASCQVSSNSVQRLQRRSRKCLIQSDLRAVIFDFRSARFINTNLVEDVKYLRRIKFHSTDISIFLILL